MDEAYRGGQTERWRQARDKAAEARKAKAARIVRRMAGAQVEDQDADEAADAVNLDGIERLDEDVYGDVLSLPLGEIVARICADLGIAPDWSAFAHEAWAEPEIAARDPRSPFGSLRRASPPAAINDSA